MPIRPSTGAIDARQQSRQIRCIVLKRMIVRESLPYPTHKIRQRITIKRPAIDEDFILRQPHDIGGKILFRRRRRGGQDVGRAAAIPSRRCLPARRRVGAGKAERGH